MRRWRRGEQIVLREVWRGRVWSGRPLTVVQDTPELIALYMAPGTLWKRPSTPEGRWLSLPTEEWVLADTIWEGSGGLRLTTPGVHHSVLAVWDEKGRFAYWYVNLEEPLLRTPLGFDFMDQTLDIVVWPDLQAWRWKDEEDFAEAQARGIYSPEEARAIRGEGERVLEVVGRRGPPFSDGWEGWRPDPSWPLPRLPAGWDRVETK